MNNKMAIAAVVVIVVALAAFGTYIIYSDDGADDGIEVPVSQPSVGDFITTKMTEPDGTVWERTYVLTIAEDDMAAEIIVNSYGQDDVGPLCHGQHRPVLHDRMRQR